MTIRMVVLKVDDEVIDFDEFVAEMKDYLEDDLNDDSIVMEVDGDEPDANPEDFADEDENEEKVTE